MMKRRSLRLTLFSWLFLLLINSVTIDQLQGIEMLPGRGSSSPQGSAVPRKLYRHSDSVYAITFGAKGLLFTGSRDGSVIWWDTKAGKRLHTKPVNSSGIASLGLLQGGSVLVSGGQDGRIHLTGAIRGQCIKVLLGHEGAVFFVGSLNSSQFVSASKDGTLRIWETPSGRLLRTIQTRQTDMCCAAISSDGRFIAVGDQDGFLRVWTLAAPGGNMTFRHRKGVNAVQVSPDGKVILSGGFDHTIRMWDTLSGQQIRIWKGHQDAVTWLSFPSHSISSFVSGGYDGVLHGWNFAQQKPTSTLRYGTSPLWSFSFSPFEKFLIAGYHNGSVVCWEPCAVLPRSLPLLGKKSEIEKEWGQLASEDSEQAYASLMKLLTFDNALKTLRPRFVASPGPDSKTVTTLLTNLNSSKFGVRKAALQELALARFEITTLLEHESKSNPSLHVRRQLESLLAEEQFTPRQRQLLRGIQLLEYDGSELAVAILRTILKGSSTSRLSQEARAALQRIRPSRKR